MFSNPDDAIRLARARIAAGDYDLDVTGEPPPPPRFSIALSREAGSGGTLVAREVGRRLNWPTYDHELLSELARELEVDATELERIDERPGSRLVELLNAFGHASTVTEFSYFHRLVKILLALGGRGDCILVGRGATIVLPPETTLRVRVVAAAEDRIAAVGSELGLDPAAAARHVETTDRERRRFIMAHFRKDLGDPLHYDLVLNCSRFSVDEGAGMVIEGLRHLQARPAPA